MVWFLIQIIFLSIFTIIFSLQQCPDGWILDSKTLQCYYFSNENSMAMDQAELFCNNQVGGNLASIHSNDDLLIVENLSNKSPFLTWIGLQSNDNGNLSWTDGSNVNFTKWDNTNKPQLDHQQCFALRTTIPNDGFVSLHCSYNQPFICKQKVPS